MCLIICPLRPLPAFLAVCVGNGGGRKLTHTLKFFISTYLHLVCVKLFESSSPISSAIAAAVPCVRTYSFRQACSPGLLAFVWERPLSHCLFFCPTQPHHQCHCLFLNCIYSENRGLHDMYSLINLYHVTCTKLYLDYIYEIHPP